MQTNAEVESIQIHTNHYCYYGSMSFNSIESEGTNSLEIPIEHGSSSFNGISWINAISQSTTQQELSKLRYSNP